MKKLRMTQEQFDNWINAMESGDYRFGRYRLLDNGCHCALGVLADINDFKLSDNSVNNHAYELLESKFKIDNPGHVSFNNIIGINDNTLNAGYQLVIDYLKNDVEIYDE